MRGRTAIQITFTPELRDRVRSLIDVDSMPGHWLWRGSLLSRNENVLPRGVLGIGRYQHYATWIVWEMYRFRTPNGLRRKGLCKHSLCVNPDHLYETDDQQANDCSMLQEWPVVESTVPLGVRWRAVESMTVRGLTYFCKGGTFYARQA